jgi:mono/diheme cytochrome c family protein/glucose/arabinose dehydrogenase
MKLTLSLLLASLCLTIPLAAQNGDRDGETQTPLPADLEIPPAPVLSVDEALASFDLAPGLRIECVASEPLVVDPVCVAFDGEGRLWVAEMRAYMPTVDGKNETEPNGCIAVLSDTDGDGVMDERVEFLCGLVLPRAILPYRDGALVIEPPELVFCRDTDGDGKADTREVIETGLGGIHSPEHAINALRWSHDNWVVCANHRFRYREGRDGWERQATNGGGQWGLSLDAEGRAFFNTNSDPLRGDAYSSHYAVRNPNHGTAKGVNRRWAHDMEVWPGRITPGVNRGYQGPTLRDDYTLHRFTGACGPLIHLGDALPEGMQGDAFVAEPCGNLIKRYVLEPDGNLGFKAKQAYEGREFLTSTDERFRPVELVDGPDGGLYLVDMYRGLIQHRLFVTSWLRAQVLDRDLDSQHGHGRIYRIVAEDHARTAPPKLSEASWTELVEMLGHPNGWWRITAQRVLVEEVGGDPDALELLRDTVKGHQSAWARRHALLALNGLGHLDTRTALIGLRDLDPRVVLAAVRCAEVGMWTGQSTLVAGIAGATWKEDRALLHQTLLSLGEARTETSDRLLFRIGIANANDGWLRSATLSSSYAREGKLLHALLDAVRDGMQLDGQAALLHDVARAIVREGRHEVVERLTIAMADMGLGATPAPPTAWAAEALASGWLDGRPPNSVGEPGPVSLLREPKHYARLVERSGLEEDTPLTRVLGAMTWPGGPNATGDPVRPLTPQEHARFESGRELFATNCVSCHLASGLGSTSLAPPLRFSSWLLKDPETPARIVLGGLHGPIEVRGKKWDLEMPSFSLNDQEVANLLTYIRREWGHGADPVDVKVIERIRKEVHNRTTAWTAKDHKPPRKNH